MAALHELSVELFNQFISRGHLDDKHIRGGDTKLSMKGLNAFRAEYDNNGSRLGPDLGIETPDDALDYLNKMVDDPKTIGFRDPETGGVVLYNVRDNVMVPYNPFDGGMDFGSGFRYANTAQGYQDKLEVAQEAASRRAQFHEFSNVDTPDAARTTLEEFVNDIKSDPQRYYRNQNSLNLSGKDFRDALDNPNRPGREPGALNNREGLSKAYTHTVPEINKARPVLENGAGFIAGLDTRGRPNHMFFADHESAKVVELKGGEVMTHDFSGFDAQHRGIYMDSFLTSKFEDGFVDDVRNPNLHVVQSGGYDALADLYKAESNQTFPHGADLRTYMNNLKHNDLPISSKLPFGGSGDAAARNVLGMSEEEFNIFKYRPSVADIDDLAKQQPEAARFYRETEHIREMMSGDDAKVGLRMYKEHLESLAPKIKEQVVGVADAAENAGKTQQGLRFVDDTLGWLKKASVTLKGFQKFGLGVLVVGGSFALTKTVNAAMIEDADDLTKEGKLTPEQHQEYKELMEEVAPLLEAQTLDVTPAAILTTVIVERVAYNKFEEFSNKHRLSQDVHERLSPAMITGTSMKGEMMQGFWDNLPDDPAYAHPSLLPIYALKTKYNIAEADLDNANRMRSGERIMSVAYNGGEVSTLVGLMAYDATAPDRREVAINEGRAFSNLKNKTVSMLSDPETGDELLKLLPKEQLLEIINTTRAYNDRDIDPRIKKYFGAKDTLKHEYSENPEYKTIMEYAPALAEARANLYAQPDVMRSYVTDIFDGGRAKYNFDYDTSESDIEKIERSSEYIEMAIPMANMRANIQNDEHQLQDMRNVFKQLEESPSNQNLQNVAGLVQARFPSEFAQVEHDLEQEKRKLEQEALREEMAQRLKIEQQDSFIRMPEKNMAIVSP
ncbi:MAG: hypothetical protein ACRBCK_08500 [Alphaproteobacteria bacterium]